MTALILNLADCEVRGVIRFLQAENVRPCEIHQKLVAVYGEHVMNAEFHLFLKMKEHLDGKRHADYVDQRRAVMNWLNSQAAVWYEEGISKLVSRYDKCFNAQGHYVETWVKVCDKTCIFFFFPIIH
jgi:hypothetical protein